MHFEGEDKIDILIQRGARIPNPQATVGMKQAILFPFVTLGRQGNRVTPRDCRRHKPTGLGGHAILQG